MNSKQKSSLFLKNRELAALQHTPTVMCRIAMITDIFIFRLLTKTRLFSARPQTGSTPTGYTQSGLGYSEMLIFSSSSLGCRGGEQHDPNKLKLNPMMSLQMKPQYMAKKPIMSTMYLSCENIFSAPFLTSSSLKTRYRPMQSRISPCPMSPNITPKKKGKVTVVKMLGLISWQRGTPQVLTISCGAIVQLFESNAVGGFPKATQWRVGEGTMRAMWSASSLMLLAGTQMLAMQNWSRLSILLRLSQRVRSFHRQIRHFSMHSMPFTQPMNSRISFQPSSSSPTDSWYCRIASSSFICSFSLSMSFKMQLLRQKVSMTFCSFLSRMEESLVGQITNITSSSKSLNPKNLKSLRVFVHAYPLDTRQIMRDRRNWLFFSTTPTMKETPFIWYASTALLMQQSWLSRLAGPFPKNSLIVSRHAILSRISAFPFCIFSIRELRSQKRLYSSSTRSSQISINLASSIPRSLDSASQISCSFSMKRGSLSSYSSKSMLLFFKASEMAAIF